MSELEGQTAAPETPETTSVPAQTVQTTSFVKEDGTFAEKWTESLDSDLRDEKTLSLFKNVKDLAKSYANARKMIGKDKIGVPNEKSTPQEWEAFYEAGGRPKTVADYKLDYPKDMPVPENVDMRKQFTELAHKSGLSQKQLSDIYNFYNDFVKKEVVGMQQSQELAKDEAINSLKETWGKAYEQRIHYGNVALEKGAVGDDELKQRLIDKFGSDPDFIKYSSNLGNLFAEHKTISTDIPTPSDYQTQIETLMENPLYKNGTQAQRMRIANQIVQLREKMAEK